MSPHVALSAVFIYSLAGISRLYIYMCNVYTSRACRSTRERRLENISYICAPYWIENKVLGQRASAIAPSRYMEMLLPANNQARYYCDSMVTLE